MISKAMVSPHLAVKSTDKKHLQTELSKHSDGLPLPQDQVEVGAETQDSATNRLGGFGKAAVIAGLGVAALGLAATPAQAHDFGCGWETSESVEYDAWGNENIVEEEYNTCNGEHVIYENGYLVHHDFHGRHHYGHHHYGHRHYGHHHEDDEWTEQVVPFLFGLGLGAILSQ